MDDDFNTPEALAVLFDLAREINKLRDENLDKACELARELKQLGSILGLLYIKPEIYFQNQSIDNEKTEGLSVADIEKLIESRKIARANRQWAESDRIRNDLKEQGVILEDNAQGTTWRRM